ncbi:hypothetical protein [Priestia megaterium]|uniref:hypothetical protein n=1 Tax=Priestia megaterium TaxID=1404 RepID=UPI001EDA655D|nr:hypothetical protein [Priestia megaterium]MDH3161184.1 hypothetical protein [Priestia megaterium]MED4117219.1 hypothetical protein [Priestia megaterium]UKJ83481.1 hypothetical protein H1W83_28160 [Priestia megaterium]
MTYTEIENLKIKLNKYNKQQFEEFCLYLSSSDLDANKRNEIRDEILDHLLEGEKEGKDFQDLFGQNPRNYTKQLVAQLPKSSLKEKITFIFSVIIISIIIIISNSSNNSYLFMDVILFSILNGMVVFSFFKLTKRFAFKSSIVSLLILTLTIQVAGLSYYVLKNLFIKFL